MTIDRALSAPWRDDFILSAECRSPDARSRLYRGVERGVFTRVAVGVFVLSADWMRLSPTDRHLARMRAIAITNPGAIFSHFSAAVAWLLPLVDVSLSVPHLIAPLADGGRSKQGMIRHCRGIPDHVDVIDGLRVTGLARTVLDVAAVSDLGPGVVAADHVLRPKSRSTEEVNRHRATRDQLLSELESMSSSPGAARARRAIEFADGDSGSPGESISRVAIHQLGLPVPILQQPFYDAGGLIGYVDFWWPNAGLIGEFDGVGKYLRSEWMNGRTAAEVVVDEKKREDRLRAQVRGVARWGWDTARSAGDLRRKLVSAGLQPERAARRAGMSRPLR